jgi:hypothetical protein
MLSARLARTRASWPRRFVPWNPGRWRRRTSIWIRTMNRMTPPTIAMPAIQLPLPPDPLLPP